MKKMYILMMVSYILVLIPALAQESKTGNEEVDDSISQVSEKKFDRFVNNQEEDRKIEVIELEVYPVEVSHEIKTMSKGENTAVIVKIPEADIEAVQKGWQKVIRNKTKSKIRKELNETWIASTLLPQIYQEPLAVYGKIIATQQGVDVIAFFAIDSVFINDKDDKDKITSASQFMHEFGISQYQLAVKGQLKDEEKKLKTLKQRLTKLQKENEKLHKSIKANESNIINKESDIEVNKSDQAIKSKEVEKHKLQASAIGDPDEEKAARKALKDKEKEKKKLQKQNQEMHKDIAKYKAEIEKAKREIQFNLDNQAMENEAIKKQIVMVRAVENKLNKIK